MLPQAVSEQYRAQQRLVVATLGLTRREWAAMGSEFDTSWATIGPRVTLLTASAQLGAARNGAASVPAVLAEIGQSVDPDGAVNARAFAGIASDGRPLDSLLYGGVTAAKTATRTMPQSEALAVGGRWLDRAIHTMVADAGRGAAGVAISARQGIGYVRMVNSPCCSRCAVLAGKWSSHAEAFDRHPRCDCQNVATGEAGSKGLTTDPRPDQITGLNTDERKALAEGADLNQVVNAKRGASGMTTTEGTTRRGVFGGYIRNADGSLTRRAKGSATPQRLTPAGIYRLASDRTEVLKLLKQYGYLL